LLKAQVNVDLMSGHVSMYTSVHGGGGGYYFLEGVIEFFCDAGGGRTFCLVVN
jgi:hypothetical protein